MSPDADTIYPTVLYRLEGDQAAVATAPTEDGPALLVFRSEADAEAFRREAGRFPASEGFAPVNVGDREISDLLEIHDLSAVAMPERWTGHGRVDLFTAENFLRLLEQSTPV